MEPLYAITIGAMVSIAVYLMLSRHFVRFLFGIIIISNAVNLAIFTVGRLGGSNPPFIPEGMSTPVMQLSNSLPQALILTAIVIGFGLLAFSLGLCYRLLIDIKQFDVRQLNLDETRSLRQLDDGAEL